MSLNTVKCNNCNVVINELLAFLRNVIDFMDEESVHQLCISSYTAAEIVKSKTLLFESVPSRKKMPVRRKDGKKKMSRDLDDMICLLKGTNPELFPIFVAKELHKLPPVSFDHVDVTRLLKDILKLQNKMMRRLKIYTMCLLLGVSILLIIDTLRCTNNTSSSTYNENVLEETRSQIKCDTYDDIFLQSKDSRFKNLIKEDGGEPLRSLIISSWRSGSTFLGDLVTNVFPSTYYTCEPLLMYGFKQFRAPTEVSEALSLVNRILKCDYEGSDDYFEFIKNLLDGNIAQLKIINVGHYRSTALQYSQNCKIENKDDLCYNADFYSRLCKLYPFQSMKIVRLRLKHIEEVLDDKALNVKVILLVRDPRGVMQSRLHLANCMLAPDCNNPALLCENMVSDYEAAGRLLQQYPDQLMVMRFEELALQPNVTSDNILRFLKASRSQAFDEFLQSHTKVEEPGFVSTSRVSRNVPYKWKTALDYKYVSEIQMACRAAMRLWGYKMAHNETHMTSEGFDPVDDYTVT